MSLVVLDSVIVGHIFTANEDLEESISGVAPASPHKQQCPYGWQGVCVCVCVCVITGQAKCHGTVIP